jgi:hypothetical protein
LGLVVLSFEALAVGDQPENAEHAVDFEERDPTWVTHFVELSLG